MKKTLVTLALLTAGAVAVSAAQAQPAPAPPAPPAAPAPTTTANPNAPPAAPSAAPTAPAPAPTTPAPVTTADPNAAPPAPPPAGPAGQDPNAPPPPPPVSPPPVAPPATTPGPAVPPPTPFVPPPAPTVSWTAAPTTSGADTVTPTDKPKPLRWRGTSFEWYQYANTQYFGLGASYIGKEDFAYVHILRFAPNFYVVDEPKDKLTVSATIWGSVEATHSNAQQQNEFLWRDISLSTKYTRTLFQTPDGEGKTPEYTTKAGLSTGIALPTSKASMAYRYLTYSLAPSLTQQFKILGAKSDLLPNGLFGVSFGWTHFFNKTNVPTSPNVNIPRQSISVAHAAASGRSDEVASDIISSYAAEVDWARLAFNLSVPIYKDLSFAVGYTQFMKWKGSLSGQCVDNGNVLTGSACPATGLNNPDKPNFFPDTIFDVSLAYNFFDVLDAAVGYSNWTSQLGTDGRSNTQQHNVFYSTDATFYLDMTVSLDGIYSKATNRDKKTVAKGYTSSMF